MARISIKLPQAEAANQALRRTLSQLDGMESELAAIRRALPADVKGRYGIDTKLERQRSEMAALRRQIDRLLRVAQAGVDAYRSAELRLARSLPGER